MSRLHLALLGAPQVRHGQKPLSFRTRKGLALLTYLAVEEGIHTRERLTALFWPESDPSSGRANLRSTLMYLRKTLAHGNEAAPDHLLVERGALGFDRSAVYELDLETVEAATDAAGEASLQDAINLVRGEFLEGFSLPDAPEFDDWMAVQRERWHLQLNDCFKRLSQRQLDSGALKTAEQTLQRWLAHNPLEERAYRRLMRLQHQQGNRSGALQTFERCREVLAAELGVEPAAETTALAQHVRSATVERLGQEAGDGDGTKPRKAHFSTLPLVGRAQEHQALAKAFRQAQSGQTGLVIVEGEAGIGKTRLASEFLDWAGAAGAQTLAGRAYETGGRLPYQPLVSALQAAEIPDLSPIWLAELSRLLPTIRDRYPDLPPPVAEEQAAPTRLFEAVTRMGAALAARGPLVLMLDDVQWADAASRDLLLYAFRRWSEESTSLLLLLTLRSESLAQVGEAAQALRRWLHDVEQREGSVRLHLQALDVDALGEMLQTLAPDSDIDDVAKWLFAESGGHPFYLMAMLETLLEEKIARVVRDSGGWRLDLSAVPRETGSHSTPIPPGVRQLIRRRLARLTPEAFDLSIAAAVLGQDVSFRQLCQVAGQSNVVGLAALDQLTGARLLESKEQARSTTYRFSHDKIRDVVYTEAGDARRQIFHERAFYHLQENNAPPTRLAYHASAASLLQPAFRYHLAAGDEALDLFAVRNAIDFYEEAQQVWREQTAVTPTPAQIRRLYEHLGRAYELVNRWQDADEVYKALLSYARAKEQSALEVAALIRLSGVAMRGDWLPEQALTYLDDARALAETQENKAGLIEINSIKAQLLSLRFDRETAVAHGERALTLARELGDDDLLARTLNYVSYARFGPPAHLSQVEAEATEARRLFARLGKRALEADSLAMVGHAQTHQGRAQEAVQTLREAQTIVRDIENSWGQVNVSFHLAFALVEAGEAEAAFTVIEEGMKVARRHQHDTLLANVVSVRGTVYQALGELEQARADHEEAQARFFELPFDLLPAIVAVHLCADCVLEGDWQAAYEYAKQSFAVEDLTWLWVWTDAGFFYHHVVKAFRRAGDDEAARTALARFKLAAGDNPRYLEIYRLAQGGKDDLEAHR
ncbi:MAG: AAA family ATPase [Chloroflexota bacterium]